MHKRLVARRCRVAMMRCMRKLWALMVVAACGTENPCDNTVCPPTHRCEAQGAYGQCVLLPTSQPVVKKDAGAGGGGGSVVIDAGPAAGGGSGGGGGGGAGGGTAEPVDPTVFVTLSYDVKTCAMRPPAACFNCRKTACVTTKEMKKSAFDAMRTADFTGCAVTSTGSDGYSVRCDNCRSTSLLCTNGQPDTNMSCANVPGTYPAQCGWWR